MALSLCIFPASICGCLTLQSVLTWGCYSVLTGDRETLWSELKAGAESGWDFSSRWLVGGTNPDLLSSIRTSKMVPVDLNAFLCQAEELMSNFYSRLGEHPVRGDCLVWGSHINLGHGTGGRAPQPVQAFPLIERH